MRILYRFDATPTVQQNGQVSWKLCYRKDQVTFPKCGLTEATYPDVDVPIGETGVFQFTILGDTGIVFAPNPPNQGPPSSTNPGPVWVQKKGAPNGPGIDPQIEPPGGGGSKKLTFVDLNTEVSTLKYQLNFVDAQGKPVTALDPEIINGGKGLMNNVALLIAGGVAIALLALWAWRIVSARRANAAREGGAGIDQRAN